MKKKINKYSKGFTLIELLAVIIILAVLMLIAIPAVSEMIINSRKKSFENTASNLIDEAKRYVIANSIIEGKSFTITSGEFVGDSFSVKGRLPENGNIAVNYKMETAIAVTDGTWCAKKDFNQSDIKISPLTETNCTLVVHATCVAPADYTFNETTKTIASYMGTDTNPIIPESFLVGGTCYDVENIGSGAFWNKGLESVEIPNTVKIIEPGAFNTNVIQELNLPNSLIQIGDSSFAGNQIKKLIIPDSVTTIGNSAFAGNPLTEVNTGNGVTSIGSQFSGIDTIKKVTIGSSVTTLGENAFSNLTLDNLNIPATVMTIRDGSFYNIKVKSLTINAQNILSGPFANSNIENLIIQSGTKRIESAFGSSTIKNIDINSKDLIISNGAFSSVNPTTAVIKCLSVGMILYGTGEITTLSISGVDSPVTIENGAFFSRSIANLTVSNATINTSAFGYANIKTVVLNNVTFAGSSAFTDSNINNLTLNNIGSTIPSSTFSGNNLTSILIPSSVTTIGVNAFYDNLITQGNARIDNAAGNVTIGESAFDRNGSDGNTSITPTFLK